MKEVELQFKETRDLFRVLRLGKKITKSQLLHKRLIAEFWEEFQRNHDYKNFTLDNEKGKIFEIEFEDQIKGLV